MTVAQLADIQLAARLKAVDPHPAHGRAVQEPGAAAFPRRPVAFLWHYIRRRQLLHLAALAAVLGAAAFASLSQYGLKLIVDAMEGGPAHIAGVWWALAVVAALVRGERILWRCGSWWGNRAVLIDKAGANLDLFKH